MHSDELIQPAGERLKRCQLAGINYGGHLLGDWLMDFLESLNSLSLESFWGSIKRLWLIDTIDVPCLMRVLGLGESAPLMCWQDRGLRTYPPLLPEDNLHSLCSLGNVNIQVSIESFNVRRRCLKFVVRFSAHLLFLLFATSWLTKVNSMKVTCVV